MGAASSWLWWRRDSVLFAAAAWVTYIQVLGSLMMLLLHFKGCELVAQAAPLPAPDITICQTGFYYPTNVTLDCCPVPPKRPMKWFSFEEYEGKRERIRVRRPVHRLDAAYWKKYNLAYKLLNELPDDDPRSHVQQRLMHCAYCDASLPLPWESGTTSFLNPNALYANETVQIHFGWNLLPWHRWFLYFHERILASVLGDADFALPFWNWDNQLEEEGFRNLPNRIADEFASGEYPYLSDANRSRVHQPPALVDFRFDPYDVQLPLPVLSDADLRQNNLAILHQALVSGATTPDVFFGRPVRAGDPTHHAFTKGGQGTVEAGPHDVVHLWTGSEESPVYADMGTFYYSTRDPIFFTHHSNLDRIWTVWKQIGDGRRDLDDPDWLDTEFVFYDENQDLVKVRLGDGLDTLKLGYTYEEVSEGDAQWISFSATPCSTFTSPSEMAAMVDHLPKWKEVKQKYKSRAWCGDGPLTVKVSRPKMHHRHHGHEHKTGHGGLEEVLVLEGVQVDWTKAAHFEVFLMLANATAEIRVTCAEFAGMFTTVPRIMNAQKHRGRKVTFKLGIGNKLRQLGASALSHVAVTILPGRRHTHELSPLRINKIKIKYE